MTTTIRKRISDATKRLSASDTTARAMATAAGRSAAWTVTTLVICPAMCALIMLALWLMPPARPLRRTQPDPEGGYRPGPR